MPKVCSTLLKKFISHPLYRTLAQYCHNIEHLDLSECKRVTDLAVQALSSYCFKLASIYLESCAQITDSSLKALSDRCHVSINSIGVNERN